MKVIFRMRGNLPNKSDLTAVESEVNFVKIRLQKMKDKF